MWAICLVGWATHSTWVPALVVATRETPAGWLVSLSPTRHTPMGPVQGHLEADEYWVAATERDTKRLWEICSSRPWPTAWEVEGV